MPPPDHILFPGPPSPEEDAYYLEWWVRPERTPRPTAYDPSQDKFLEAHDRWYNQQGAQ